jgi:HlyD family secretion protein
VSQVRIQPIAEQSAIATSVGSSTLAAQTTTVPIVVSYATMIDVENPDDRLRPGMTASVVLTGLRHADVTRVPNAALSFRPSADTFKALGENEPPMPDAIGTIDGNQRARELWVYDGTRLTPRLAQYGLSDDQWTEVTKGSVRPGDRIVTKAVLRRVSRF